MDRYTRKTIGLWLLFGGIGLTILTVWVSLMSSRMPLVGKLIATAMMAAIAGLFIALEADF